MTPFVRKEDGLVVFVKRGWVPQKTATWSRPNGVVTLVGVASSCEKVTKLLLCNRIVSLMQLTFNRINREHDFHR